jgi:hypothetical protein
MSAEQFLPPHLTIHLKDSAKTIDIREYIDCSLARPAGLVLVE